MSARIPSVAELAAAIKRELPHIMEASVLTMAAEEHERLCDLELARIELEQTRLDVESLRSGDES